MKVIWTKKSWQRIPFWINVIDYIINMVTFKYTDEFVSNCKVRWINQIVTPQEDIDLTKLTEEQKDKYD